MDMIYTGERAVPTTSRESRRSSFLLCLAWLAVLLDWQWCSAFVCGRGLWLSLLRAVAKFTASFENKGESI